MGLDHRPQDWASFVSRPVPLAETWRQWAPRLQQVRAVALFSDFDGTLAPIVRHAARARLPLQIHKLLQQLAQRPRMFVGIVSGRSVADLRRLVRLRRLGYIGIHGLEVAWPRQPVWSRVSAAHRARIEKAKTDLEGSLGDIRGLWLENKSASVAVHFRNAAANALPRIEREVRRVHRQAGGRLKLQSGKKILELLPALGASKGTAVLRMLRELPRRLGARPFPIYLGDDATDESVFSALAGRGLCVRVGADTDSVAPYFVPDAAGVRRFLRYLLTLRSG